MGNIFKVFFSFSVMILLNSCDVFLVEKNQIEQCNIHLETVYQNTPLNNFEQTKFKDLLENRFPKYEGMFQKASLETSIDSELLAAISFQESQWDPKAKSNMGVRGMMMVTLETAAIVGVEKRLNPEQNITGGAKYIAMLQERNVYGKTTADQLSISLAKYNLGPTNIINIAKQ
jgi:membrane-bound lytic murein transglycosylase F